ncbi:class I SAM-dependent methyltransferase [Candidatus Omnitrophota bacterium]
MDVKLEEKVGKIKDYYEQKVKAHQGRAQSSMPDAILIDKEVGLIASYIKSSDRVLDAGCANGYSTMKYAEVKKCRILGIDYSAGMIKNAKKENSKKKGKIKGSVEFAVGDVTRLAEKDAQFDKVTSKRCIINLPSWPLQKQGLGELIRVLKKGGELLLSEASEQGWQNMNRLRAEFGLEEVPQPWFNLYLNDQTLCRFMEQRGLKKMEILNFSSTYYIGSRVIQPFVIGKGKQPRYDSEINRLFSQLPDYGDYGTQKFYRFKKVK